MRLRHVLLAFVSCLLWHDVAFAFVVPTPSFTSVTRRGDVVLLPFVRSSSSPTTRLFANKKKKGPPPQSRKKRPKKKQKDKEQMKEQVGKAAAEILGTDTDQDQDKKTGLLNTILDPFQAGKKFRKTVQSLAGGLSEDRKSIYYFDDKFSEPLFSERNPMMEARISSDDGYVPEVLVIGATGEVGRLVVRRLLLDGRSRVRVLVRDLYSKTLNLLGTGVTYCQGDLNNMDSLEYALTDVDKIVFCASPPKPDEADFQTKFQTFCQENLNSTLNVTTTTTTNDLEWEQLESVRAVRAKLAEQVDCIGMQNLVRAYQNVRHADYGTSQAAKRSLFKFQDRPEDFNLFALEGQGDDDVDEQESLLESTEYSTASYEEEYDYDDEYEEDDYEDEYSDLDEEYAAATLQKGASVKTQCQWIRNKFEHGVFVGKVPKGGAGLAGEASIVSSRLRSREEPKQGIDLSNGFAGFVLRVCSDGGRYEAFVRSGNYETDGIEYVCEFTTETKPQRRGNKSRNKFQTVRLPFINFKPVQRREISSSESETIVPPFKGADVRQIGFRYRSESNPEKTRGEWSSFYLAFSYIKVYRSQPEPEFIYLSDSRIPPVIRNNMVRHDVHQIVTSRDEEGDNSYKLLDQAALTKVADDRSSEETYYKYRGEEILKGSGLSYTIVRVSGYNELPSGEASTIDLKGNNEDVTAVSRDEVAQVCASALLDPNALNKSIYMSKAKRKSNDLSREEDVSSKFAVLPADAAR